MLIEPALFGVNLAGSTNLKSTYPGVQSLTVDGLTSGGTTNFYIVKTGIRQ